jgi:hypothetical protein
VIHSIRASLSVLVLAAALGAASAEPQPDFIAALRADFIARDLVLASAADPVALVTLGFGVQAIYFIDQVPGTPLVGQLKVLKKVASHIEKKKPLGAYGRNGAGLPAALATAIGVVDAEVIALQARVDALPPGKFHTNMAAKATDAAADVEKAKKPWLSEKKDNVTWRTGNLVAAQQLADVANAKIDGHVVPCDGEGTLAATIDGVAFAPPHETVVNRFDGLGALNQVQISGFYYDATLQNPYAAGSVDLLWTAAAFQGAATYPIDATHRDPTILLNQAGVLWSAVTGTITVSAYDPAKHVAVGTFSGTLRNSSGATTTIADGSGSFNVCRFVDIR